MKGVFSIDIGVPERNQTEILDTKSTTSQIKHCRKLHHRSQTSSAKINKEITR